MPYNNSSSTVIETNTIVSVAATLDIGPGVKAQHLHRDDFIWQYTHTVKEGHGYQMGSDSSMGLLVPGVNTTKANGATLVETFIATRSPWAGGAQFVRGSHLRYHSRRPKTDDVAAAEMTVEEAFLVLSSLVHAGGASATLQRLKQTHPRLLLSSLVDATRDSHPLLLPFCCWPPVVCELSMYCMGKTN